MIVKDHVSVYTPVRGEKPRRVHMRSEADKRAQAKYDRERCVQVKMKLVLNTDADIIERLNSVPNRQGYIKSLIRKDIAESK